MLRHVATRTDLDISLGLLPYEIEVVDRSKIVKVGPIKLRFPPLEGLMILKAVAHHPKHILDIQGVAGSYPPGQPTDSVLGAAIW